MQQLPRRVTSLAITAFALALTSAAVAAQPAEQSATDGFLTAHATPDGRAGTDIDGCKLYIRGHGVPLANGTVTFYYAPNGTYEPEHQELPFVGTANENGTYDFLVGPFSFRGGGYERANLIVATFPVDDGVPDPSLQLHGLTCTPTTEVPFFTSPLALGLGMAGIVGSGLALRRKR